MDGSTNLKPTLEITLKTATLERLLNLIKGNTDFRQRAPLIIFPAYGNKVFASTESFTLDEEDIEYLRNKYTKKYKEELTKKLEELG